MEGASVPLDLTDLVPLPALCTPCGIGIGMAVCPLLGLLATSCLSDDSLSLYALPDAGSALSSASAKGLQGSGAGGGGSDGGGGGGGLGLVRKVGPTGSTLSPYYGVLAFTGPASSRVILATDAKHDTVHVIHAPSLRHGGYVAAPGSIVGPRGVAAWGALAAVSTWTNTQAGDHVVHLFEGSGPRWALVRVLAAGFGRPGEADGQLSRPRGLRFSADGQGLAVVEAGKGRLSLFRVADGAFVRHATVGLGPFDVEECEGGWLAACYDSNSVEFVGDGPSGVDRGVAKPTFKAGGRADWLAPIALALVPGLGLVVREYLSGGRLRVFAAADTIAMSAMSLHRVGWMVAVARAALPRSST